MAISRRAAELSRRLRSARTSAKEKRRHSCHRLLELVQTGSTATSPAGACSPAGATALAACSARLDHSISKQFGERGDAGRGRSWACWRSSCACSAPTCLGRPRTHHIWLMPPGLGPDERLLIEVVCRRTAGRDPHRLLAPSCGPSLDLLLVGDRTRVRLVGGRSPRVCMAARRPAARPQPRGHSMA